MAYTERTGLPSFWVTHVAAILVGDMPCLRSAWTKGRYKFEKSGVSASRLADFKIKHTAMLAEERDRQVAAGWRVSLEKFLRVTGKFAILSGKADLIAQKTDCRPKVLDCKGGEPRDTDVAQVKIYQVLIPMAWHAPAMQFDGEVVYSTQQRMPIKAHEVGPTRDRLFPLLKKLGTMDRPEAVPSEANCRFCDVPVELCAERIEFEPASAQTEDF